MEIFTQDGLSFLSRWAHFLFGITWIGLLYYFNFVQTPSFATFDAGARTEATRRLVPRALWYFRYAAAATVAAGILILLFNEAFTDQPGEYITSSIGTSILTGALFGMIMLANVWMVIWPAQQIAIANAERVAAGGAPDPAAADAARRGLIASRTNVLLSVPMLFFMAATSHFAGRFDIFPGPGGLIPYWVIILGVAAVIEANALGQINGYGPHPVRQPLESVQNVIIAGFALTAAIYLIGWEIIIGS